MSSPLTGIRVVELSHMVMGPTCGMVLGDLGAEVIKVEPLAGDKTRTLAGLGAGFFRAFNRNKKSLALDLDRPAAREVLERLIASADVFCENFRPGRMQELGLHYQGLRERFPKLIYVSHKGFLPGPYENRRALDEVVQMMSGLAYMTGPPGQPLRMGASVNDIMGGVFGALGAVSAILERRETGQGQEVQSALFENCAFLASQHMQQFAKTGVEPMPMPKRHVAWAIYEVFSTADNDQVFIGVVSDGQWRSFCEMLGRDDWGGDPALASNTGRVEARPWLMPDVRAAIADFKADDLKSQLEAAGIPYAPIARPQDLFDDPHLNQSGGLGLLTTETGETTKVPLLPFTIGGRRFGARKALPGIGEDSIAVLEALGYTPREITEMVRAGIVGRDGVASAAVSA
ncbi:CaiB/BaiF CoA-transferase family protein [Paraburkholderia tropica]|uniref:CaiB/BaiF CoA transferase family protein n=1 Tax=Paraburkholderia tropica TaxID=92647 RepID=UPI003019BD9E